MRLCIVDDDPLILEALTITVRNMGHEAFPSLTVEGALTNILPLGIDAAIVDILMPVRDGMDFIMSAKKDHPALRIIAMSGGGVLGSNRVLSMAKGIGADAVLPKPFSASDLEIALGR
jgi:DNA-binding response OmpR family regulator